MLSFFGFKKDGAKKSSERETDGFVIIGELTRDLVSFSKRLYASVAFSMPGRCKYITGNLKMTSYINSLINTEKGSIDIKKQRYLYCSNNLKMFTNVPPQEGSHTLSVA